MQPKTQKLGRGLSALLSPEGHAEDIPVQSGEASSGGARLIALKKIQPGKWQPRKFFNDQDIESLAESIKKNGVLQPILVRHNAADDTFEIVAGERRWRAALRAQLSDIPVIVKDLDDATALTIALVENIQREDLSPLEEAEGYQKLIDEVGFTQEKISVSVGKSRSHVANILRLLQLPDSIKEILHNLEISSGHARCLIGLSEAEGLCIIDEIIQKNLNVRQVERLIRQMHKGDENSGDVASPKKQNKNMLDLGENAQDSELQHLADKIEEKLALKATIQVVEDKGKITLTFNTFSELDAFMGRISAISK